MHGGKCESFWKCANRLGMFFVLLFIVCFIWYFVRGAEVELHMQLLKLSFFGFKDMGVMSFILGAIQSYVWGHIFTGLWCLVCGCGMMKKEMTGKEMGHM